MKSFFIFLAGGLVSIFVLTSIIDSSSHSNITTLEQEGKIIEGNELKVFQVINQKEALVYVGTSPDEQLCLLTHDGKELYYDDQKVIIPNGMVAKQFGVYQYKTTMKSTKTVPAIRIEQIKK